MGGRIEHPVRRELAHVGTSATPRSELSAYVSRSVAARLATGRPIQEFEALSVQAALLLTDIVGFTAHVERVSASRPSGLDDLARDFDAYFTDVVSLVHAHGGDILCIAGDAFFSYWPADEDDDLTGAVLLAAETGLAIQAKLGDPRRPVVHRFQSRAGVSGGMLRMAYVGGVGARWELMPIGAPIEDVAEAERRCSPSNVMVAEPAWRQIESRCEGDRVDDRLFQITRVVHPVVPVPSPPTVTELELGYLLSPYVPLPVSRRQLTAGSEWMQEKRRVTVLMVSLGTTSTDTAALELRHHAVRAFQRSIDRFEGTAKVNVDSKGVTLSGVFGLPPHAHPDDARRAVTAAATIRRELDEFGLPCSLGVATGRAFCGVFGNEIRREYTLHGEVVNLATRLMQLSGGELLCAAATVREAGDSLAFEPLAPVVLKGSAIPVAVYRPSRARRVAAGRDLTLVGREEERSLFERRLDELIGDARSGTIVVEGEAGLGKTRLVAEAGRLAQQRGVRVLAAAADPVESATSYYAWRAIFGELLDVTPGTFSDPHTLNVPCEPELRRLRPLLSSIVPVGIPDNELTAAMDGNVRAENTKLLLASILRRTTATRPMLVVVEDAHWLDSNSWGLLLEVVESVPGILVAVTMRPMDAQPEQLVRIEGRDSTDVMVLDPLHSDEIRLLVEQRLGVGGLPVRLTDFVDDRVAGHPFFCEQLVETLHEGGVVQIENGAVIVGDLDSVDVPATIEGAVLSRVDRLTASELLCLKVGAVIGRSFLSRTVADTLPVEAECAAVPAHLETLAKLDLTTRDPEPAEPAYRFRHEITRDVAYKLLTAAQGRRLHRAVAEWHERSYSEDALAPHYALLAHHWARAEVPDKTVAYLERAGRQALRNGAFREALKFLTNAIEVQGAAPDAIREAMCQKGMGTAHYFLGDFAASRACLARALAVLARPFPATRTAVALELLRETSMQISHLLRQSHYQGRRSADRVRIAEALGCYKIIGQIGYLDGEPTANLVYGTLAGLNLGEEAGSSPDLARMLIHAATASSIVGLETQADRYANRAIAMVDAGAQREASAYVWNIWAVICAHRGHWALAEAANATALGRLDEVGDFNLEAEVWQTRSAIYICSGAFGAAESAWRRHRELAERKDNAQNLCWSLLDEAESRVGRDEIDAAAVALEAALAIPTTPNDGSSTIEKLYATAIVRAMQGRFADAIAAADGVIDVIARRPPAGFHYVDFCAGAVRVYLRALELGRCDRAVTLRKAERGCKLVRRAARTFGSVRSRRWLLQGLLDWEHGRADRADAAWRRAEVVAIGMDAPYECARARWEIARHGRAGAEREPYLADAAATFERLGALQMLRLVRETQANTPTEEAIA